MNDRDFLAIVTRSVDLRIAGDLPDAAGLAAYACDARPNEPSAWHTLAMVSADLGKHDEALYCRRRAVELLDKLAVYTKIPDAQGQYIQQCVFGYATSLMLHGDFETAWPYWEIGRLGYSWSPPQGTVYWQGQDDGNLLAVCEGGYGDLFLFSRFLPMLRERYPNRWIGLIVFKGLRSFRDWYALGVNKVYEIDDPITLGAWKYSTSIMSLPAMLGLKSLADVPSDRLWDIRDVHQGIGFCWRSEENQTKRRFRSLPLKVAGEIAASLGERCGPVRSLSPSRKDLGGQSVFNQPSHAIYEPDRMVAWSDTAAYIAGMERVVTVDTAVAHLAGLLNIPTLLLLPLNSDWKWQLTGDRTPWYPSVRLFRNQLPLEWERERIVETAIAMYQEVA